MSNDILIRRANPTLADARTLLAIEHASLADSPYTPEEAIDVLRRPEQVAYLAYVDEEAVGFCSCLETLDEEGRRLEVDMLGVVEAHRGHGVGRALIAQGVCAAQALGIRGFRAAVAVDNIASQRAFQHAGFTASEQPYELAIYEIGGYSPQSFLPPDLTWRMTPERSPSSSDTPNRRLDASDQGHQVHWLEDRDGNALALAECLAVHTLAYRGLWIEKLAASSEEATRWIARALVEHAKALRYDEVGYLVPQTAHEDTLRPLLSQGFLVIGSYYVFTLRLA